MLFLAFAVFVPESIVPRCQDYQLANLLIRDPSGSVVPLDYPVGVRTRIMLCCRKMALAEELLDRSETKYIFDNPNELQIDLDIVRSRRADLGNAPSVAVSRNLPNAKILSEWLVFNRAVRDNFERRMWIEHDRSDELASAMAALDECWEFLDLAIDSQRDYYSVTNRRTALKKLESIIGRDALLSGRLPSPVPMWVFTEKE